MGDSGYSFPKEERLHHRSLVEGVYRGGKSFYEFPFRVTWRILKPEELLATFRNKMPEGIGSLQMMVTVPKKKRKRAVDRVLLRRRIREAYRLQRLSLRDIVSNQAEIGTLSVAIVYIHDKNLSYRHIEEKLKNVIDRLNGLVLQKEQKDE